MEGSNRVRKLVFQPSVSVQAGSSPLCGPAVRGKSAHFLAMLVQAPAARNEQRSGWKGRVSRLIWVTGGSLRLKPMRAVGKVSLEGVLREGKLYIWCCPMCQISHTCCSLHETSYAFPPSQIICLFVHLRVPNVSSGFHGFPGLNGLNGLPGTKGSPGTPGNGVVEMSQLGKCTHWSIMRAVFPTKFLCFTWVWI